LPKEKEVFKMDKKGFVSMHPGLLFLVGLLIGAALMYYVFMQGWLTVSGPIA
jgi:uncharacterized protein (UPF0333 family)